MAKAWTFKAETFEHTARAWVKICITSDSLTTGDFKFHYNVVLKFGFKPKLGLKQETA